MYSNCSITSLKHFDLFSKIFEVFNEMEIEVNVINDEISTKLLVKIRVRGKEIS